MVLLYQYKDEDLVALKRFQEQQVLNEIEVQYNFSKEEQVVRILSKNQLPIDSVTNNIRAIFDSMGLRLTEVKIKERNLIVEHLRLKSNNLNQFSITEYTIHFIAIENKVPIKLK